MVQPSALEALRHVEAAARWHASEPTSTLQRDAATFLTVLGTARSARGLVTTSQPGGVAQQPEEDECWSIARHFAADCSMNLTRPVLAAAMTYELLDQAEPIAVLISTHQLTRRELDLALAQAQHLPYEPEPESRRLLRGPQHSQTLAN